MHFSGKKQNKINKLVSAILVCVLAFSFAIPREALAKRGDAGGAELDKYTWEDFGIQVGMFAATFVAGCIVSGVLGSAGVPTGSNIGSIWGNTTNLSNIVQGYNTYMVASQVGRGAGYTGAYYDWDKSQTFLLASVASGAAVGALNADVAAGTTGANMAEGAALGAVGGAASGATIYAIDRERIDDGKDIRPWAQVLGMAAGDMAVSMGRFALRPKPSVTIVEDKAETNREALKKAGLSVDDPRDIAKGKAAQAKLEEAQGLENEARIMWQEVNEGGADYDKAEIASRARACLGEAATLRKEAATLNAETSARYRILRAENGKMVVDKNTNDPGKKLTKTDAPGYYKIKEELTPASYAKGLLKAAFVDPISGTNGTSLVSRSLAVFAWDKFKSNNPEKEYMETLVKGVVQGIASPLLNYGERRFSLDPALYLGTTQDRFLAQKANDWTVYKMTNGKNEWQSFRDYALRPMTFHVFDSAIGGTIDAAFGKWSTEWDPEHKKRVSRWDPLRESSTALGINMISAILRGTFQYAFWSTATNYYSWQKEYHFVAPFADNRLDPASNESEWAAFKETSAVTGGLMEDSKGNRIASLIVSDEKPGLAFHLGSSINQALAETFFKGLSFGRPFTRNEGEIAFGVEPKDISPLTFMDYVGTVRYLASSIRALGGDTGVLAYQFRKASIESAGNALAAALAQVNVKLPFIGRFSVADTFSIRPERLVFLNTLTPEGKLVPNANLPYTMQWLSSKDSQSEAYMLVKAGKEGENGKPTVEPMVGQGNTYLNTHLTRVLTEEGKAGQSATESYDMGGTYKLVRQGEGAAQSSEKTFWSPFPNIYYNIMPVTGAEDYLREKGRLR